MKPRRLRIPRSGRHFLCLSVCWFLFAVPSNAAEGDAQLWRKLADHKIREKTTPETIWEIYEKNRDSLDDLAPAKDVRDAWDRVHGTTTLLMVALALEKAETDPIFEAYLRRQQDLLRIDPASLLNLNSLESLCLHGRLSLAAREVAFVNSISEKRFAAQKEKNKGLDIPDELTGSPAETTALITFYEAVQDWEKVRILRAKEQVTFDKAMAQLKKQGLNLPFLGGRENIQLMEAQSKFLAGNRDEAEKIVADLLTREKSILKGMGSGAWGPQMDTVLRLGIPVRMRMLMLEIRIEQSRFEEAEVLCKELDEMLPKFHQTLTENFNPDKSKLKRKAPNLISRYLDLKRRVAYAKGDHAALLALAEKKADSVKSLPVYSPLRVDADQTLAWTLLRPQATPGASDAISKVVHSQAHLASSILATGSERQKLTFLQFADLYSLSAASNDAIGTASLAVGFKGSIMESVIHMRSAEKKAEKAGKIGGFRKVRNIEQALINAKLTGVGDIGKLEADLENAQTEASIDFTQPAKDRDAELNAVIASLETGDVFCDYIRYRDLEPNGNWKDCYGVVVLVNGQQPTWIQLGDAGSIDTQVVAYLDLVGNRDQPDTEARLPLRALFDSLLKPVLEKVPGSRRLVICPDSKLSQISFAVLLSPSDEFVAADKAVVYVSSGRDLLGENSQLPASGTSVVLGNPEFSSHATDRFSAVSKLELNTSLPFALAALPRVGPLVKSGEEANKVSSQLTQMGFKSTVLTGENAGETQLREQLNQSPSIVHLATHGFILTPKGTVQEASSPDLEQITPLQSGVSRGDISFAQLNSGPRLPIDSPLERSLLALRGAKSTFDGWQQGKSRPPEDDGLLMASEISLFDLNGTFLAILSACNTAQGEPVSGEGIMGLRRGFLSAGTDHLVMTFWLVDDDFSVRFFTEFYEALSKTSHPAVALNRVQRETLRKIRAEEVPEGFVSNKISKAVRLAGPFGISSTGKLPPSGLH